MANEGKIDAARFNQGLTYQQYITSVENNREEFQKHYDQVNLTQDDREFFSRIGARLGTKVNLLVLVEDWCPDVVRGLPIAAKIAEACPDLELRVFPRDENLDIMDHYLHQGKFRSIPTFVFLDEEFVEIGRWVERPASANAVLQEVQKTLEQQNLSEDVVRQIRRQKLSEIYASKLVRDTIDEMKEVLSKRDQ